MIGCEGMCPLEAVQQDARSVGIVGDAEIICRAAYDPMHFKKGKIQSSVVKADDLFAGTLSVWRVSEKANTTLGNVVSICQSYGPANTTLGEVRGIVVKEIRDARRPEIEGRLYCVIDETDTDENGGSHPAHAHIRICSALMKSISSKDDINFQSIKAHLAFLMRRPTAKLFPA